MTAYESCIAKLERLGYLERSSPTGWYARCPAHEDTRASLSVSRGTNGRALMHCHSGCDFVSIRDALRQVERGDSPPPAALPDCMSHPVEHVLFDCSDVNNRPDMRHPALGAPDGAVWAYMADADHVWAYVCRWETENGKEIRPLALFFDAETGDSTWKWRMPDGKRPLLGVQRWSEFSEARIFVVEGEKTADAAMDLPLPGYATTWIGGSTAVAKADWTPLAGRDVTLVPDNDEPGRKAMAEAAKILEGLGARVTLIEIPAEFPEKWDLADEFPPGWNVTRLLDGRIRGIRGSGLDAGVETATGGPVGPHDATGCSCAEHLETREEQRAGGDRLPDRGTGPAGQVQSAGLDGNYWVSCSAFTGGMMVAGGLVAREGTMPILGRFVGQPPGNVRQWVETKKLGKLVVKRLPMPGGV